MLTPPFTSSEQRFLVYYFPQSKRVGGSIHLTTDYQARPKSILNKLRCS